MLLIRMPDERVKMGNMGFCEIVVKLLEKYQLANDDNIAGQVDRYPPIFSIPSHTPPHPLSYSVLQLPFFPLSFSTLSMLHPYSKWFAM